MASSRQTALIVFATVLKKRRTLSQAFAALPEPPSNETKDLCYGVLRFYEQLSALAKQLMQKPLKEVDSDLYWLILCGIYQLLYSHTPSYAAVNESVTTTRQISKPWAAGLVNGVLRNFIRQQPALLATIADNPIAYYSHPQWLIAIIKRTYPDHWQAILKANNDHPPLCLRVATQKISVLDYGQLLTAAGYAFTLSPIAPCAVTLHHPLPVQQIPGFTAGLVSIQDSAAQLAATFLAPATGERILDACAAPGGKAMHLLETTPDLAELVALDNDPARLSRIEANCQRLRLHATLLWGDARRPSEWWDGQLFDRILLDAPCTGSGVIRRHPESKLLRRPRDIIDNQQRQLELLQALWPLLKPQGYLLYATCSIFLEENEQVILPFCATQSVQIVPLSCPGGLSQPCGLQLLPTPKQHDGFYYALLYKSAY